MNQVSREQAKQGLHGAQSEVSVVEIGQYAWIGLATGVVSGLILGLLAFSGRVPLPGIAQTLSASSSAVFFVGWHCRLYWLANWRFDSLTQSF